MKKWNIFYQKVPAEGRMFNDRIILYGEFLSRYSYMATIEADNLEEVFSLMNSDKNPLATSEGQEIIMNSGTGHTSISMNDIIVEVGNPIAPYRVARMGFQKIVRYEN